ncbi:hypothetical protein CIK06_16435 [Plantactinospora sp. KBS50]|nr:hypothetical protein CIK06_16435 [Plantactinospora sp. KBS50]
MLTAGLAAAAVAAVVVSAVSAGGRDPDRGRDPGHGRGVRVDTASGLLVTGRSALRMCVENGGGAQAGTRTGLRAGLDLVRADPNWAGAYGRVRVDPADALAFGCPAPRLPQRAGRAAVAGPGLTATPSPYRVWVYVLDGADADRILGPGQPSGLATAELVQEANTAWPVSTALLIRRDRLGDPRSVAEGLRAALGLVEAGTAPAA